MKPKSSGGAEDSGATLATQIIRPRIGGRRDTTRASEEAPRGQKSRPTIGNALHRGSRRRLTAH